MTTNAGGPARTRVTGIGSLPGTDVEAATRLMVETCSDLIPFPELPARGPHAGMIGRALALLDGLAASFDAGEWRLSSRPGADGRRARQTWRDDIERFHEASQGRESPVKVAIAGPWTLAASVLRPYGGRILADRGARRDVAQALAQGTQELREEWRRRGGDDLLLQVDEPLLPAVLGGKVPTEGGYFRHRPIDRAEVVEALRTVAGDVFHSCAPGVPWDLVVGHTGAGFTTVALDVATLTSAEAEALGVAMETGLTVIAGVVPTANVGVVPDADAVTCEVSRLGERLGVEQGRDPRLALSPACGLAGWEPSDVPRVFRALSTVARRRDEA